MNRDDSATRAFFDECALQGDMDSFSATERQKLETAILRWNIAPGHRVLEPGCGTGRLTPYLSLAVLPEGEVFSCDLSAEMIKTAGSRNLPEHVTFYHCSAGQLPKDDNYFDKAVCFAAFPHFSDKQATLTEISRVLKPDGELWIEHFKSRSAINDMHNDAHESISAHVIPSDDTMKEMLGSAGFTIKGTWDSEQGYSLHAVKQQ